MESPLKLVPVPSTELFRSSSYSAAPCPLISVIVPVYNHQAFLTDCLDSVLAEGYPNLELLVLDDGSTDNSFSIAQEWARTHQRFFKRMKVWSQPNAGVCKTLNRLIGEAQGAFVTMLASDDRLLPGGISARLHALQSRPEWLLVFGDAQMIDGAGRVIHLSTLKVHRANMNALMNPKRMPFELLLRWSLPGPVFLAHRSAWDPVVGVGPYDETLFLEDRDFYLRLLAKKALGFLARPVAQYRVHGANACKDPVRRPQLRETLARSAELNAPRFYGAAQSIVLAQARERRAALDRKPWLRLRAKAVLALYKLWHQLHGLRFN